MHHRLILSTICIVAIRR